MYLACMGGWITIGLGVGALLGRVIYGLTRLN